MWKRNRPNMKHRLLGSLFGENFGEPFFSRGLRVSLPPSLETSRVSHARELLRETGFSDPNELKQHFQLPQATWLVIEDRPCGESMEHAKELLSPLHAALILGLSGVAIYSPDRPVIWSETRLARKLFLFQPSAFYTAQP
jgi:hypothetical protein